MSLLNGKIYSYLDLFFKSTKENQCKGEINFQCTDFYKTNNEYYLIFELYKNNDKNNPILISQAINIINDDLNCESPVTNFSIFLKQKKIHIYIESEEVKIHKYSNQIFNFREVYLKVNLFLKHSKSDILLASDSKKICGLKWNNFREYLKKVKSPKIFKFYNVSPPLLNKCGSFFRKVISNNFCFQYNKSEQNTSGILLYINCISNKKKLFLQIKGPNGKKIIRRITSGWQCILLTNDKPQSGLYSLVILDKNNLEPVISPTIWIEKIEEYSPKIGTKIFKKNIQNYLPNFKNKLVLSNPDFSSNSEFNNLAKGMQIANISEFADNLPQKITLDITKLCNLKCPMCWRETATEVSKTITMSKNSILSCIAELGDADYEINLASSGESTMHPDFEEIVDFIATNPNKYLVIRTNGLLIKKNINAFSNVDHVDISLEKIDGYEDTRVGGKLTELIKNLEILNKLRFKNKCPTLGMSIIPIRSNLNQLKLMLDFAIKYRFCHISGQHLEKMSSDDPFFNEENLIENKGEYDKEYEKIAQQNIVNILLPSPFLNQKKLLNDEELFKNNFSFLKEKNLIKDNDFKNIHDIYHWRDKNFIPQNIISKRNKVQKTPKKITNVICDSPWTEFRVDAPGWVYTCCSITSPCIGNINNNSIIEIWNSSIYKQIRNGISLLKPVCRCSITSKLGSKLKDLNPNPEGRNNIVNY